MFPGRYQKEITGLNTGYCFTSQSVCKIAAILIITDSIGLKQENEKHVLNFITFSIYGPQA